MFVSSDAGNMIPAIECTVSFKDDECEQRIFGRSYDDETLQALINSHSLVCAMAPGTSARASRVTLSPAQRTAIATSGILIFKIGLF